MSTVEKTDAAAGSPVAATMDDKPESMIGSYKVVYDSAHPHVLPPEQLGKNGKPLPGYHPLPDKIPVLGEWVYDMKATYKDDPVLYGYSRCNPGIFMPSAIFMLQKNVATPLMAENREGWTDEEKKAAEERTKAVVGYELINCYTCFVCSTCIGCFEACGTSSLRTDLREKYGLPVTGLSDFLVHVQSLGAALVQEHKEHVMRIDYAPSFAALGVMPCTGVSMEHAAPEVQLMTYQRSSLPGPGRIFMLEGDKALVEVVREKSREAAAKKKLLKAASGAAGTALHLLSSGEGDDGAQDAGASGGGSAAPPSDDGGDAGSGRASATSSVHSAAAPDGAASPEADLKGDIAKAEKVVGDKPAAAHHAPATHAAAAHPVVPVVHAAHSGAHIYADANRGVATTLIPDEDALEILLVGSGFTPGYRHTMGVTDTMYASFKKWLLNKNATRPIDGVGGHLCLGVCNNPLVTACVLFMPCAAYGGIMHYLATDTWGGFHCNEWAACCLFTKGYAYGELGYKIMQAALSFDPMSMKDAVVNFFEGIDYSEICEKMGEACMGEVDTLEDDVGALLAGDKPDVSNATTGLHKDLHKGEGSVLRNLVLAKLGLKEPTHLGCGNACGLTSVIGSFIYPCGMIQEINAIMAVMASRGEAASPLCVPVGCASGMVAPSHGLDGSFDPNREFNMYSGSLGRMTAAGIWQHGSAARAMIAMESIYRQHLNKGLLLLPKQITVQVYTVPTREDGTPNFGRQGVLLRSKTWLDRLGMTTEDIDVARRKVLLPNVAVYRPPPDEAPKRLALRIKAKAALITKRGLIRSTLKAARDAAARDRASASVAERRRVRDERATWKIMAADLPAGGPRDEFIARKKADRAAEVAASTKAAAEAKATAAAARMEEAKKRKNARYAELKTRATRRLEDMAKRAAAAVEEAKIAAAAGSFVRVKTDREIAAATARTAKRKADRLEGEAKRAANLKDMVERAKADRAAAKQAAVTKAAARRAAAATEASAAHAAVVKAYDAAMLKRSTSAGADAAGASPPPATAAPPAPEPEDPWFGSEFGDGYDDFDDADFDDLEDDAADTADFELEDDEFAVFWAEYTAARAQGKAAKPTGSKKAATEAVPPKAKPVLAEPPKPAQGALAYAPKAADPGPPKAVENDAPRPGATVESVTETLVEAVTPLTTTPLPEPETKAEEVPSQPTEKVEDV